MWIFTLKLLWYSRTIAHTMAWMVAGDAKHIYTVTHSYIERKKRNDFYIMLDYERLEMLMRQHGPQTYGKTLQYTYYKEHAYMLASACNIACRGRVYVSNICSAHSNFPKRRLTGENFCQHELCRNYYRRWCSSFFLLASSSFTKYKKRKKK